jgi:hypothetical protein
VRSAPAKAKSSREGPSDLVVQSQPNPGRWTRGAPHEDRTDALAVLETMPLSRVGVDRPLLVARGELRAEAGRCQTSVSDFTAVIEADRRDAFEERALQGRATCRLRLGNRSGARSDMERYLVLYPAGRFAVETQRALGRSVGAP